MTAPARIVILGSTGSIGRQTLDIVQRFPERLAVVGLAANANAELLADQATAHGVRNLALADTAAASRLRSLLPNAEVGEGPESLVTLAAALHADVVVNALVGAAGLRATLATLSSGARLALANKESLVIGGPLVMTPQARGRIIPVDSEHSALFQCLLGEDPRSLARLWLTASGGPFRGRSAAELECVTVQEALAHPRWTMGRKITVDSATLMNKGLEVIEAHFLFGLDYDRISVVVHPQSCVHSMAEFTDGSVKAHLGVTDMRIPIQYALSHPERWDAPLPPLDFTALGSLDFEPPDAETFRCLALAYDAGRAGGTMPAVLNAANEVAVAAFLAGSISLTAIPVVVETIMGAHDAQPLDHVDAVEAVDAWARERATRLITEAGARLAPRR